MAKTRQQKFHENVKAKFSDDSTTAGAREAGRTEAAAEKIVNQAQSPEPETSSAESETADAEREIQRMPRRRQPRYREPDSKKVQAAKFVGRQTAKEVKWRNQLHVFFALSASVLLKAMAKGHF